MKKVLDTGTCSAVFVSEAPSGTAHAASSSTGPATGASVVCIGSDRGALRRTGGGGSHGRWRVWHQPPRRPARHGRGKPAYGYVGGQGHHSRAERLRHAYRLGKDKRRAIKQHLGPYRRPARLPLAVIVTPTGRRSMQGPSRLVIYRIQVRSQALHRRDGRERRELEFA